MQITEFIPHVEQHVLPVVAYNTLPHGVWLFVLEIDDDTTMQVRIRALTSSTKIDIALDAIKEAIKIGEKEYDKS